MPRRRSPTVAHEGICVDMSNVDKFFNFIFFYKANAVAILVSGRELQGVDVGTLVNDFNSYMAGVASRGRRGGTVEELGVEDFQGCDEELSSDELVEMKEYLKSSTHLYRYTTSRTFRTSRGIAKLARAADRLFGVRVGDARYVMVIEVPPEEVARRERMARVNREFHGTRHGDLGYTELLMLANSVLARALGGNCDVAARLVMIRDQFYTSMPLSVKPLCRELGAAELYIGLVRARSSYTPYVASALLRYVQLEDRGELYAVARNMAQTRRLSPAERDALARFLGAEVRP